MIRVQICWVKTPAEDPGSPRLARSEGFFSEGASLADAVRQLGTPEVLAQWEAGLLAAAIYGERRPADAVLEDGDRIELLGPIRVDPMQTRARRAEVQRRRQGDSRWTKR
jgi:putative ubiquitin-RnfH superfamily antitoxin RatB of RatAB toxin-antitoxin module